MLSEFARDLADDRQPIEAAIAERPGKPLRIRVQPMILRTAKGRAQYRAWRDVSWTLELDSASEAAALSEVMRAFFLALNERGLEAVSAMLRSPAEPADPSPDDTGKESVSA